MVRNKPKVDSAGEWILVILIREVYCQVTTLQRNGLPNVHNTLFLDFIPEFPQFLLMFVDNRNAKLMSDLRNHQTGIVTLCVHIKIAHYLA